MLFFVEGEEDVKEQCSHCIVKMV